MKKVLLTAVLFAGCALFTNAQTQKKEEKKTEVKVAPATSTAKPATMQKAKVTTTGKVAAPAKAVVTAAAPAAVEKPGATAGVKIKKDGTPDKRYKKAKKLKKDGTADMRYKDNKPQ